MSSQGWRNNCREMTQNDRSVVVVTAGGLDVTYKVTQSHFLGLNQETNRTLFIYYSQS